MKRSTAEFLLLFLMFATLLFGCLVLAVNSGHGVWYFVSGLLVWPTFGTLKDGLHYYRLDLARQG